MANPLGGDKFQSQYTASFNSFSGVDMKIMFGSTQIGELQGVSVTVTREKAPLYVMGNANPRAFSRGKRGIAGSLIFLVFDRDAFISAMRGSDQAGFAAWKEEGTHLQQVAADGKKLPDIKGSTQSTLPAGAGFTLTEASGSLRQKSVKKAWYADQVLPFDIVITAENEYGAAAQTAILGCEILNAGSGMSVDDITTDTNMTFVARECVPWTPVGVTPVLSDIRKVAAAA